MKAPVYTFDHAVTGKTSEVPPVLPFGCSNIPTTKDILSACELVERLNPQRKWSRRVFTMSGVNSENFANLQKIAENQKSSDEWVIDKLEYNFSSMELIITDRIRKK